jgi:hypothetical protein
MAEGIKEGSVLAQGRSCPIVLPRHHPVSTMNLPPLPQTAQDLCRQLNAPPRLIVHLQLVHEAAGRIVVGLKKAFPGIILDEPAILFGAATHDLGKTLHPAELGESGKKHQVDGPGLLISKGVDPLLARFALTHSQWDESMSIEDFVVALADKVWKGRRLPDLEAVLARAIAGQTGVPEWQVVSWLDEILGEIADGADERLAYQGSFGVNATESR